MWEMKRAAVMLPHYLDRAGSVCEMDRRPRGDEIETIHRFVMLAHEIEALGRAEMIVEGDARADDVDEGGAVMRDRCLQERHELRLVAGEAARDEGRAELHRHAGHVDGGIGVHQPALALRPRVRDRRDRTLGEAVDAVVLDQILHSHPAAETASE